MHQHDPTLIADLARRIQVNNIQRVRFAWCDLHGHLRCKTLMRDAAINALSSGIGMVGTLMLKDPSDRTAFPVFDKDKLATFPALEGFALGANLQLLPRLESFHTLPWDSTTGHILCEATLNGQQISFDPRQALLSLTDRLAAKDMRMLCGLELEFHVYRILEPCNDPSTISWPAKPPRLGLLHPGYRLLSESYTDTCSEVLQIIEDTALALALPLTSVEIEFGPSQFEAVFSATDSLQAADNMVLFRSVVSQALRRAGYYVTFTCRPPFDTVMSCGWHLHQSLQRISDGMNLFSPTTNSSTSTDQAGHYLSSLGSHYLAGLLEQTNALAAFAVPSVNAYDRFRPNALAPVSANWGPDSRGALLRVLGGMGNTAARIENRLGEPAANPYLVMASQGFAGLDGIERSLEAPLADFAPFSNSTTTRLPSHLGESLDALEANSVLLAALGKDLVQWYSTIKRFELARFEQASTEPEFDRQAYFASEYF